MPQNLQVGSRVRIAIDGEERDYFIVQDAASAESDIETISAGSQIGKALLGKQAGETVEIVIEGTPKLYRVVSIQ